MYVFINTHVYYLCVIYLNTHMFTETLRGMIQKYVTSAVQCRHQIRTGTGHSDVCMCVYVSIEKVCRLIQHDVNK